jgi:hypothetical protein
MPSYYIAESSSATVYARWNVPGDPARDGIEACDGPDGRAPRGRGELVLMALLSVHGFAFNPVRATGCGVK